MKKVSMLGLGIWFVLTLTLVNYIESGEKSIEGKERVLLGEITSVLHNYQAMETYIRIKGEELVLSPRAEVFNKYNAPCRIESLSLPFLARVVITIYEKGVEQVTRIEPGEK